MNKFLFLLALMIFSGVIFPGISFAADDLPDNFYQIESAGLLDGKRQGGLGDGAWEGSELEAIVKLIQNLPLHSDSPAQQRLTRAVLLSSSSTEDFEDDKVVAGEDFLTLRLNTLLKAGDSKTALKLYTTLTDETPYHPNLAKAGILSMLGSGEKSTACLEVKTFDNGEIDSVFWDHIRIYCNASLNDEISDADQAIIDEGPYSVLQSILADENYRFVYDPESFAAISKFEQVLLIAEQAIDVSEIRADSVAPQDIRAILAQESISAGNEILLSVEAVRYGLLEVKSLATLYKEKGNAFKIPQLYQKISKAADDGEKATILKEALALRDDYDAYWYLPFADYFAEITLSDISLSESGVVASVFYILNRDLPNYFSDNFLEKFSENDEISSHLENFLAISLMRNGSRKQNFSQFIQKKSISVDELHFFSKNVIENLDKPTHNVDNALKVYEKDFVLTSRTTHAMPSQVFWNRFNLVGENRVLGETALLSIYALNDLPISEIYPGFFNDLRENLNIVGLTDISHNLAVEGLLGINKEKDTN